jgi:hypothetical protein
MKIRKYVYLALLLLSGCTMVSSNRVFPKMAFYWSKDAELEHMYRRQHRAWEAGDTNWFNVK